MKVLKTGTGKPPPFLDTVTCGKCSAFLEYTADDVQWKGKSKPRHSHDVDGDLVGEWFDIKCPECNSGLNVTDHIPPDLRRCLRPTIL